MSEDADGPDPADTPTTADAGTTRIRPVSDSASRADRGSSVGSSDRGAGPEPARDRDRHTTLRTIATDWSLEFDRAGLFRLVAGIAALALAVRLYALGGRPFHWDEARVGYWILRFHETGQYSYRPIVHGPFLPVVNDLLFSVLPPTDAVARLPVAVVGGLVPLCAWLFRDRLRDVEVVALAGLLAVNPLLVYYSRFMRNDVLVAAFALAALGFVVRGHDRADARYLVPAGLAVGLAFTTKENAPVYLLCFLGAGGLLVDHRLLRAVGAGRSAREVLTRDWPDAIARHLARVAGGDAPAGRARAGRSPDDGPRGDGGPPGGDRRPRAGATAAGPTNKTGTGVATPAAQRGGDASAAGALAAARRAVGRALDSPAARTGAARVAGYGGLGVAAGLLVATVFYAPRPALWQALGLAAGTGPSAGTPTLVGVVGEATVGSWRAFVGTWAGGTHQAHDYLPYLYDFLETLAYGAPAVAILAAVGALVDGYADADRRGLVAFATYWGAVSVVGYPIATDIEAPWAVVHAVVPLAIPAAVGAGFVVRSLRADLDRADWVGVALAGLVLAAGGGGMVALNADYFNAATQEDAPVLQWAQPDGEFGETARLAATVAGDGEGTDADVLYLGTRRGPQTLFYVANESSTAQPPPGGPNWHSRLPFPWYFERANATATSTAPSTPAAVALSDPPPVIVAYAWNRSDVAAHTSGYVAYEHAFKLHGERVVVFVRRSALPADAPTVSAGAAGANATAATAVRPRVAHATPGRERPRVDLEPDARPRPPTAGTDGRRDGIRLEES
jgi:predicted membrane-bound mannosyltransferase